MDMLIMIAVIVAICYLLYSSEKEASAKNDKEDKHKFD